MKSKIRKAMEEMIVRRLVLKSGGAMYAFAGPRMNEVVFYPVKPSMKELITECLFHLRWHCPDLWEGDDADVPEPDALKLVDM